MLGLPQQKPIQYCKAIILQLIIFFFFFLKEEDPELSVLEECLVLGVWRLNVTLRSALSSQVAPWLYASVPSY